MESRYQQNKQMPAIWNFILVLIITILPRIIFLNTSDKMCLFIPNRHKEILCCHAYLKSTGILTSFPFLASQLDCKLGPTHPWLICITKEPLPFRS